VKRALLFVLAVALIAIAGVAIFLYVSTPREPLALTLPLADDHRRLLARVPAGADAFALIPRAAALEARLRENPATAQALEEWTRDRQLPSPWMLGRADLVVWHSDEGTTFAFHLDPFRALLLRTSTWFGGPALNVDGSTVLIGPAAGQDALADHVPDLHLGLGHGLSGHAVVVQRRGGAMFPPIARPAVSTVTVTRREVNIVSRSGRSSPGPQPPVTPNLPLGGLISAWFSEPTRVVTALDRIVPGDVVSILSSGGSVVLYDVEGRRLLPRPRGVFITPDNPQTRAAAARLETVAEIVGGVERRDGQILIALDRQSLPAYATEDFEASPFPSNLWAVRIDPGRMLPVVEDLADHRGLRFAAPELSRSAGRLRDWISRLSGAKRIDAAALATAGGEELRVRVTAK
jgi:hypothetical protein